MRGTATDDGRAFHARAAVTGKARSPSVKSETCTFCCKYMFNHAFIHTDPQTVSYFSEKTRLPVSFRPLLESRALVKKTFQNHAFIRQLTIPVGI